MELTAVLALQPGMEIAQDVCDYKGNIIMRANTCLDKFMIQKLSINSITCVYIKEPEDYKTTYFEKIRFSKIFNQFYDLYNDYFEHYKIIIDDFIANPLSMDNSILLDIISKITKPLLHNEKTILDMLCVLDTSDKDSFYSHALNVALVCSYTGKWFGLNDDDVKTLILAGFYYDIGKCKIPNEILNKQGRLTEEEFKIIKNHPIYGYQMLVNCKLDKRIKLAALMHHERCDGSGYPQKLTDERIDSFAKIIGIIDSYEAMTSFRTYRSPLCPFTVIDIFEKEGFGRYDTKYFRTFVERMAEEYIGKQVQLNDGRICTIVLINKNSLSRPMVKTIENTYVDLSVEKHLQIISLT